MPTPPNILFVFSDQQRWDTLGCYGQRLPVTPNLDRLAAEGVRFSHAFTCQPVCGPARACLQTGLYASKIGVNSNDVALPLDADTIAKRLAAAGYATGYVGKWHLASNYSAPWWRVPPGTERRDFRDAPVPPERRGGYRDYWVAADALEMTSHGYGGHMFNAEGRRVEWGEDRYRADVCADYALDFLRARRNARPWFLFLSFLEPHHQNDRNRYEGPHGSKERFRDYDVPGDLAGLGGDWRENYPDYLGCCHAIDQNVARLRAELERLGQWDNTLVFYASDHGSHFRTRNREYKRSCHEASIHIPLIVSGPGFRRGGVVNELVSLVDVPPTLLAAAGIVPPAAMQGRAMQPLLAGGADDWPREVFVQISEDQLGRAIRTRRWKYSVIAPGIDGCDPTWSDTYVEECLYDLERDPHEQTNLASDPALAAVRAELAETLKRRMDAAGEKVPVILPALPREGPPDA